jgi:hypothetical protein
MLRLRTIIYEKLPQNSHSLIQEIVTKHLHYKDQFIGLAADLYNAGIQKLVTRYDKCLNLHGDYVEK